MQITLAQVEIEAAIAEYIKTLGLDFGSNKPKITLVAGRGKDGMTAGIELTKFVPMGAGIVEVLDKPEVDTAPFKEEAVPEPKKPAAPKKKKPAAKKATPKAAPVEETPSAAPVAGTDALFSSAAADVDEKEAELVPQTSNAPAESDLFAGPAGTAETEDLVEEGADAPIETSALDDNLFAPKA